MYQAMAIFGKGTREAREIPGAEGGAREDVGSEGHIGPCGNRSAPKTGRAASVGSRNNIRDHCPEQLR